MILGCTLKNETTFSCNTIHLDKDKDTINLHLSQEKRKLFYSLSQSVFPVLIDRALWSLPTTLDAVNNSKYRDEQHLYDKDDNLLLSGFLNSYSSLLTAIANKSKSSTAHSFVEVSPSSLNGNAHLISQFMDLIGILSIVIGKEIQNSLPTILFPILEKISVHGNHPFLKQVGLKNLERVAKALGALDVKDLLIKNFDYLIDSVIIQFPTLNERNGGLSLKQKRSALGVIDVLLQNTYGSQQETKNTNGLSLSIDSSTLSPNLAHRSMLHDLVNALLSFYDGKIASTVSNAIFWHDDAVSEKTLFTFSMMEVICTVFKVLKLFYRDINDNDINKPDGSPQRQPWLDNLLSTFAKDRKMKQGIERDDYVSLHASDGDETETAYKGFIKYHADKNTNEHHSALHDEYSDCDSSEPNENQEHKAMVEEDAKTIDEILSRSSFFLSTKNLKVDIITFEALKEGFELLSLANESSRRKQVSIFNQIVYFTIFALINNVNAILL